MFFFAKCDLRGIFVTDRTEVVLFLRVRAIRARARERERDDYQCMERFHSLICSFFCFIGGVIVCLVGFVAALARARVYPPSSSASSASSASASNA